jgi:hypothetical protein
VVQGTNGVPTGGTSFATTDTPTTLQAKIDGAAANTVFVAATTGTYTCFRGINYGTKHPRFVFPGAAGSYSITGAGTALGLDGNAGLEVYGGTWSGYGSQGPGPVWATPIHANGGPSIVQDAVLTGSEVGVLMHGNATTHTGTRVSHCRMFNNFRYACAGGGNANAGLGPVGQVTHTLEYSILDNHNLGGRAHLSAYDPGGDAGGTKFLHTDQMICRNNWVKNNYGFGLWWDTGVTNLSAHDNVCETNTFADFFLEVVYGGCVIEHNYVNSNGLGDPTASPPFSTYGNPFMNATILVSCSPADGTSLGDFPGPNITSEIRYNDLDASNKCNGVALIDHTAHFEGGSRNWYAHHNRIYMRGTVAQGARSGLFDPHNMNKITLAGANNHFNFNEYHVATVGGTYYEADGSKTLTTFRTAGHEAAGTEVVI